MYYHCEQLLVAPKVIAGPRLLPGDQHADRPGARVKAAWVAEKSVALKQYNLE